MLAPQVFRDRGDKMMGIVDFATKDDMKYALRKLDDTEFKNPFDRCAYLESYITMKEISFYRVCAYVGRHRVQTEFDRCALFDVKHIKALPTGVVQSVEQHGVHTPLPPVQLYDLVVQLSLCGCFTLSWMAPSVRPCACLIVTYVAARSAYIRVKEDKEGDDRDRSRSRSRRRSYSRSRSRSSRSRSRSYSSRSRSRSSSRCARFYTTFSSICLIVQLTLLNRSSSDESAARSFG